MALDVAAITFVVFFFFLVRRVDGVGGVDVVYVLDAKNALASVLQAASSIPNAADTAFPCCGGSTAVR